MSDHSSPEHQAVLATLHARLCETADWIKMQGFPPNDTPYRHVTPKRERPLMDAFRAVWKTGAFANDAVMKYELDCLNRDDEKHRANEKLTIAELRAANELQRGSKAEEHKPPIALMDGQWGGYTPLGDSRAMFLERLMRGWLPLYEFGIARSPDEVVETRISGAMTVSRYVTGLRHLAIAVKKEIDLRYPPVVTVTQNVKPSEKEIALAREACVANPRILRADLMVKLEIGSDKASVLLDLMRNEGIHKTRKRKSPSRNG